MTGKTYKPVKIVIPSRILFIDNFDSFTYNLVDEFAKRKSEVLILRNNVSLEFLELKLKSFKPHFIVLSPGPSTPRQAGICLELIKKYAGKFPIMGVCLGHQALAEAFGGKVDLAGEVLHGKASWIKHDDQGLFKGIENPLLAGRYHSLAIKAMPPDFIVTARCGEIIMGIRHKTLPLEGVQFHPESILTPTGGKLLENALEMWGAVNKG
jgi:anthranilate synthase/aminodeoxychorismate synthase-like glutamine amidotransferase